MGVNIQLVKQETVRRASGESRDVLEGVDGYWASLRKFVGKRYFNTGFQGTRKRDWLLAMIRVKKKSKSSEIMAATTISQLLDLGSPMGGWAAGDQEPVITPNVEQVIFLVLEPGFH